MYAAYFVARKVAYISFSSIVKSFLFEQANGSTRMKKEEMHKNRSVEVKTVRYQVDDKMDTITTTDVVDTQKVQDNGFQVR